MDPEPVTPDPVGPPDEPEPELDEQGRRLLGTEGAEQIVDQIFWCIDFGDDLIVSQWFGTEKVPKTQVDKYSAWIVADMQALSHMSEEERAFLRPGLVRRLAKTRLTEDQIFWGGFAMIQIKRLMSAKAYGEAWFKWAQAERPGTPPVRPDGSPPPPSVAEFVAIKGGKP